MEVEILEKTHSSIEENLESLVMQIRAIPFLDSHDYYDIMQTLNKVLLESLELKVNADSQKYRELKCKIKEIIFDEC